MTTLEVNAIEYLYKEGDNEIEQAKSILNKLYLKNLDSKGVGRWDEEYYLTGLYHPLRSMRHINDLDHTTKLESRYLALSKVFDVYIHIPFCHVNCSFCHFYKEIISRAKTNHLEDVYITAILKEVENYTELMNGRIKPNSIQFGGGTPSAISVGGLKRLLNGLSERFDFDGCQEIKFEFHPDMHLNLTEYREKLRLLKDFGLTTAIIDIEATNEKVLKGIRRGNTSSNGYLDLIKIAKEENVESIASAFMIGLPYETPDSFLETLKVISNIDGLDAINIYPLMFKPSDSIFQKRRREPGIFTTPYEKDLMMIMAEKILRQSGFKEGPAHFFTKESHNPAQQVSKASSKSLLGLGPASFGYLDFENSGLQYMNFPDLDKYHQAVMSGKTGQWRYSFMNEEQVSLRKLIFALNSFDYVDSRLIEKANLATSDDYLIYAIKAMIDLNLLKQNNGMLAFTPRGRLRNSEVLYFLCEQDKMKWNEDDPEYSLLRRYEFFPNISKDNELLFKQFMNKKARE